MWPNVMLLQAFYTPTVANTQFPTERDDSHRAHLLRGQSHCRLLCRCLLCHRLRCRRLLWSPLRRIGATHHMPAPCTPLPAAGAHDALCEWPGVSGPGQSLPLACSLVWALVYRWPDDGLSQHPRRRQVHSRCAGGPTSLSTWLLSQQQGAAG